MKYLKNFLDRKFKKNQQSIEDIEKLSKIRNEVNNLFYILKDDNMSIDVQYLNFKNFKYFMCTIGDPNGIGTLKDLEMDSYNEFLDRIQECVDENDLKLSFLSTSMESMDPIYNFLGVNSDKSGVIVIGSKNAPKFNSLMDLAKASRKKQIQPYEEL